MSQAQRGSAAGYYPIGVGNGLDLSAGDLGRSAAVLRDFGNVSSPFVLFVLEMALAEHAPGGWWWLASYGAARWNPCCVRDWLWRGMFALTR